MSTTRSWPRTLWVATRSMLLLTLVLGVLFPATILGVGQLAFPAQANGSMVHDPAHGQGALGSSLIGQGFNDAAGNPDPAFFQPRPSAACAASLTASASGLDPHISIQNALGQVARVSAARSMDPERVSVLVAEEATGRDLGFLGERRVNVLELNIALAGLDN